MEQEEENKKKRKKRGTRSRKGRRGIKGSCKNNKKRLQAKVAKTLCDLYVFRHEMYRIGFDFVSIQNCLFRLA